MKNPYINSSIDELFRNKELIEKHLREYDNQLDIYITKDIYRHALNNIQAAIRLKGVRNV